MVNVSFVACSTMFRVCGSYVAGCSQAQCAGITVSRKDFIDHIKIIHLGKEQLSDKVPDKSNKFPPFGFCFFLKGEHRTRDLQSRYVYSSKQKYLI